MSVNRQLELCIVCAFCRPVQDASLSLLLRLTWMICSALHVRARNIWFLYIGSFMNLVCSISLCQWPSEYQNILLARHLHTDVELDYRPPLWCPRMNWILFYPLKTGHACVDGTKLVQENLQLISTRCFTRGKLLRRWRKRKLNWQAIQFMSQTLEWWKQKLPWRCHICRNRCSKLITDFKTNFKAWVRQRKP